MPALKTVKASGVARHELPQIARGKYPHFVQFLRSHGVNVSMGRVLPSALKPLQQHVNMEKVKGMTPNVNTFKDQPLVVAKDGSIMDGHHRWYVMKTLKMPVNVIRVGLSSAALVDLAQDFDEAKTKDIYEMKRLLPQAIRDLFESDASEEAKRKGLTHVSFGNYADKTGKVVARSKDGKLVPVNKQAPPSTKKKTEPTKTTSSSSEKKSTNPFYVGPMKFPPTDARHGLAEDLGKEPPPIGVPFVVYRAGRNGETSLAGRNGATAHQVADFMVGVEDDEGSTYYNRDPKRIYAYAVTLTAPVGSYHTMHGPKYMDQNKPITQVGRGAPGRYGENTDTVSHPGYAQYSFQADGAGYHARLLGSVATADVHAAIRAASGYENFNMAGAQIGGDVLRAMRFPKKSVKEIMESSASDEAKRRGLKHVSFGNYADKTGKVVARSENGKLVSVKGKKAASTKKKSSPKQAAPQYPFSDGDAHFITTGSDDDVRRYVRELKKLLNKRMPGKKRLSEDQLHALASYSGNGYKEVNDCARRLRKCEKFTAEYIRRIDSAMHPLPSDVVVWRGVSGKSAFVQRLKSGKKIIGAVITDKGFTSTSIDPFSGEDFAKAFLLRIEVPKGTRAVWIGSSLGVANSSAGGEDELLLARNGRYEVTGVGKSEYGYKVMTVRRIV